MPTHEGCRWCPLLRAATDAHFWGCHWCPPLTPAADTHPWELPLMPTPEGCRWCPLLRAATDAHPWRQPLMPTPESISRFTLPPPSRWACERLLSCWTIGRFCRWCWCQWIPFLSALKQPSWQLELCIPHCRRRVQWKFSPPLPCIGLVGGVDCMGPSPKARTLCPGLAAAEAHQNRQI